MPPLRLTTSLRTLVWALLLLCVSWLYLSSSQGLSTRSKLNSLLKNGSFRRRRDPPITGCPADTLGSSTWLTLKRQRQKAAILLLARDQDLDSLLPTLANFEERFNARFRYPYVFLNDLEYSSTFIEGVRGALPESAIAKFGQIPKEHWTIPDWLDENQVRAGFQDMQVKGIQYAERESYHHMCRYYSGLFALHPLLADYDYYWRLEPGVRFFSHIQYDPFLFMAQYKKVYGFVITIVETENTIPTLFETILDWRDTITRNNSYSSKFGPKLKLADWQRSDELWNFFLKSMVDRNDKSQQSPESYNLCHFWTNFEIGDLRFFRGREYQSLFEYLDRKGGFYLERWGDAPIRSLALGLLAGFDKVHYFEDIIYKHDWFMHVPSDLKTACKPDPPPWDEWTRDIDNDGWYSCLPKWRALDNA